jgi:TIR domain
MLVGACSFGGGMGASLGCDMKLFVSYRRDDSPQVTGRIYDKFVARYGAHNVFKDVDSILLGSDFRKVLEESLMKCDVLVAVIGKQWLNAVDSLGRKRLEDRSDFVRQELESALRREMRIIPLLVDGVTMPTPEELPEPLHNLAFRNATAIRPDPDFHPDMERVIRAIGEPVPPNDEERPIEHRPSHSPLRYFLYLSHTKVDMLSAQLSEQGQSPSRAGAGYSMLESVIRRLDRDGMIGECDQPRAYFRGVLDMHFADVSFYEGGGRMVLFSGLTAKGTLVGLVGSTAHVIGAPSMEPESLDYARPDFWLAIIESLKTPSSESFGEQMYDLDNMIDYQARRRRDAPKQRVEFVAKQFVAMGNLLIGSPLFVAAAN